MFKALHRGMSKVMFCAMGGKGAALPPIICNSRLIREHRVKSFVFVCTCCAGMYVTEGCVALKPTIAVFGSRLVLC